MRNFTYYTPTKVVFGRNAQAQVGQLVLDQGCKKVLVHFGGGSVKKSGLLDRVCDALAKAGVDFITLGGVVPNPRLSMVYEGIALCKQEEVDFILAVGGGSVLDSAKAIGYGVLYEGDVWDFYSDKAVPTGCLPVGAVLTIAAAGSEMSNSSVITKEEGGVKRGCNNDLSRCRFAVMDPELTYTLPKYQTSCGIVDILLHTLERYLTSERDLDLTDGIAEALMRTVMHSGTRLMADPCDYSARAQVMWAGSLSHNGLTGCGSLEDWSCHQLEHELSGMFDVAHGAGLAALWASWARYVYQEDPARFAQLAVNVLSVPNCFGDQEKTALEGIARMEDYFRSIEMPVDIPGLGVTLSEAQRLKLAEGCSRGGTRTIGQFKQLTQADMAEIYRMANGV